MIIARATFGPQLKRPSTVIIVSPKCSGFDDEAITKRFNNVYALHVDNGTARLTVRDSNRHSSVTVLSMREPFARREPTYIYKPSSGSSVLLVVLAHTV